MDEAGREGSGGEGLFRKKGNVVVVDADTPVGASLENVAAADAQSTNRKQANMGEAQKVKVLILVSFRFCTNPEEMIIISET